MKKTLIALLLASATSGSAMAAWTTNGTGGSVNLNGTLTPVDILTPWEVHTGDAVSGLDAQIKKGQTSVDINLDKSIPVLGIRNTSTDGFVTSTGIKPQISYGNAVDIDGFNAGLTTVSTNVNDGTGKKIGTMKASFAAMAMSGWNNTTEVAKKILYATTSDGAFFGGLPKSKEGSDDIRSYLSGITDLQVVFNTSPGLVGAVWAERGEETFSDVNSVFWGWYGSAIANNQPLKIVLDSPVTADTDIVWKASLPVTVSYQ